jgi:hypothetical protein
MMCEFCLEHGKGRKWYLEMKNYSAELLRADLSSTQRKIIGVHNRLEWLWREPAGLRPSPPAIGLALAYDASGSNLYEAM